VFAAAEGRIRAPLSPRPRMERRAGGGGLDVRGEMYLRGLGRSMRRALLVAFAPLAFGACSSHPTGASRWPPAPGSILFRSSAVRPTDARPRAPRFPRATPTARRSCAARRRTTRAVQWTARPFPRLPSTRLAASSPEDAAATPWARGSVGGGSATAGWSPPSSPATTDTAGRAAGLQASCARAHGRMGRFLPRGPVPTLSPGGRTWQARSAP